MNDEPNVVNITLDGPGCLDVLREELEKMLTPKQTFQGAERQAAKLRDAFRNVGIEVPELTQGNRRQRRAAGHRGPLLART